jgi:uncharacterized protein (DUF2236 family)
MSICVKNSVKSGLGFFDQRSTIWRVTREMILLAAGGRALLMQLAHPKVAAGVDQYSHFQKDPFARLYRTMSVMWSIVFDEEPQARAALKGIEKVHARVRGEVDSNEESFACAPYDANEQDLLLWVHATLVDSAIVGYGHFVAPMTMAEKKAYYDDSKTLAGLFGIDEKLLPTTLDDFEAYMQRMIGGCEIVVGPTARKLGREVLYARPWLFKLIGPIFRFVTAGLLPDKLRDGYGLKWNERREGILAGFSRMIRALVPLTPGLIRVVPNARAAERKRPESR